MFASQDNATTRKIFQKPNIVRRKAKAKRTAQKNNETPSDQYKTETSIVNTTCPVLSGVRGTPVQLISTNLAESSRQGGTSTYRTPKLKQINTPMIHENHQSNAFTLFGQHLGNDMEQAPLNIDSFLVESPKKQTEVASGEYTSHKLSTDVESKWCLNFMSEDSKDIITPTFYDGSQIGIQQMDTVSIKPTLVKNEAILSNETSEALPQNDIQNCLNSKVVKYKCDMPNCNKSFWSEARLQKHKSVHSKQKKSTAIVKCPVKKVDSEGVEQQCGKYFPSREVLVKHLEQDHVPEDASYRCARCGRWFWWAVGLRTHAQTECGRALLVCTWPGCERVFRQPCRLREHARAHTGDRPYPCTYPNCGWAFRSASKLVRHARRHTGERRHECGACGRAFLRREHLRDHARRSHAPKRPPNPAPTPCTHQGCEETFESMNALYLHLKKVHRVEGTKPSKRRTQNQPRPQQDMFVMTLQTDSIVKRNVSPTPEEIETISATAVIMPETTDADDFSVASEEPAVGLIDGVGEGMIRGVSEGMIGGVSGGMMGGVSEGVNGGISEGVIGGISEGVIGDDWEGRCARTHCTWPLQRAVTPEPGEVWFIEEDNQVEPSEGSESNNYTIRSDLFLHGNVLINEDSEFIIRESARAGSEAPDTGGQLEGLDLIDAHPAIDLMQEELMYGDPAVDESTFRVFLMNGEELS